MTADEFKTLFMNWQNPGVVTIPESPIAVPESPAIPRGSMMPPTGPRNAFQALNLKDPLAFRIPQTAIPDIQIPTRGAEIVRGLSQAPRQLTFSAADAAGNVINGPAAPPRPLSGQMPSVPGSGSTGLMSVQPTVASQNASALVPTQEGALRPPFAQTQPPNFIEGEFTRLDERPVPARPGAGGGGAANPPNASGAASGASRPAPKPGSTIYASQDIGMLPAPPAPPLSTGAAVGATLRTPLLVPIAENVGPGLGMLGNIASAYYDKPDAGIGNAMRLGYEQAKFDEMTSEGRKQFYPNGRPTSVPANNDKIDLSAQPDDFPFQPAETSILGEWWKGTDTVKNYGKYTQPGDTSWIPTGKKPRASKANPLGFLDETPVADVTTGTTTTPGRGLSAVDDQRYKDRMISKDADSRAYSKYGPAEEKIAAAALEESNNNKRGLDLLGQGFTEINNLMAAPGNSTGATFYRETKDLDPARQDELKKTDPARYAALQKWIDENNARAAQQPGQVAGYNPPPNTTTDARGQQWTQVAGKNAPVSGRSMDPNAPQPITMNDMEIYNNELPGKGTATGFRRKDPNRQQGTLSVMPGLSDGEKQQYAQIMANEQRNAEYAAGRGKQYDAALLHGAQQTAEQNKALLAFKQWQAEREIDQQKQVQANEQAGMNYAQKERQIATHKNTGLPKEFFADIDGVSKFAPSIFNSVLGIQEYQEGGAVQAGRFYMNKDGTYVYIDPKTGKAIPISPLAIYNAHGISNVPAGYPQQISQ